MTGSRSNRSGLLTLCRYAMTWVTMVSLTAVLAPFCFAVPMGSDPLLVGPTAEAGGAMPSLIQLGKRRGADDFEDINEQFRRQNFPAVIERAALKIKSDPACGLAYEILGTALYHTGAEQNAVAALKKAADLEPRQSGPLTKLGIISMRSGQVGSAQALLQKALAANAEDSVAHQHLGLILEYKGDDAAAIDHFRQALEGRDSTYLGVAVNLGRLLNKAGRYQEAREILSPRLPYASTLMEAHLILAMAFYRTGQYTAALTRFERASELDTESDEALLGMGMAMRQTGDTDGALKHLKTLIDRKPNWLPALMEYGETLLVAGDVEKAKTMFAKGVKLGSDPDAVQKRIARHYLSVKAFDKAEKIYRSLVKAERADPEVYIHLSELRQAEGKHDEGVALLEQAVVKYPDNAYLRFRMGSYLASLRRYPEAIPAFKAALKESSNDALVLKALCLAQAKSGDDQGALETAAKLYSLGTDDYSAAVLYATRLQAVGKIEAAESVYRQSLAHDADNPLILNNLADLLAEKGELAEAEKLAKRLNDITERKNGIFLDTLGWIRYRQGEYEDAVDLLKSAAAATPQLGVIHYHLGMSLAETGDLDEAREMLAQSIRLEKGDPAWLSAARKKLDALGKN